MELKKCSRCNKNFEQPKLSFKNEIIDFLEAFGYFDYNLCPECIEKFKEFMKVTK